MKFSWVILACIAALHPYYAAAQQKPSVEQLAASQKAQKIAEANAKRLRQQLLESERTLQQLSAEIERITRSVHSSERALDLAETKFNAADATLKKAEKTFYVEQTHYRATLMQLLAMRSLPASALLSSSDQRATMMHTATALRTVNVALAKRAETMRKQLKKLHHAREQNATARATLSQRAAQLATEQDALQEKLDARQAAYAVLQRDHAAATRRAADMAKRSRNLQELIARLENEERSATTPSLPALRKEDAPLRLPSSGKVLHRYGERKNANETYRGMVLAARPGGLVTAPYAGNVVFTGTFRDYGNMVLLRHSNGYISLLAGLGAIDVALNQRVRTSEPLGRMATSGTPKLYLELREKGKAIDPTRWFANLAKP